MPMETVNSENFMMANDMAETDQLLTVGHSLIQELDKYRGDHLALFDTIKANYRAVGQLRQLMQEQAKNNIEALISEHKQVAGQPRNEEEIGEMLKQELQLKQEYTSVKTNLEELSVQCQKLKEQQGRLTAEKEKLSEEKDRLDNETTIMLPKRREELSLYSNISNIRWDFEGSKDEIKGYISNRSEVKPFCIDRRKCSQYFIVNSLWDTMKED